jgi:predicted restriction endonuclease
MTRTLGSLNKVVLTDEERKSRSRGYESKRNKTPERIAYRKEYAKKDSQIAYGKKYYNDNCDNVSKRLRKYYINNRDKILAYSIQYNKEHAENILKINLERMNELGIKLDMNGIQYKTALIAWSRVLRKNGHGCEICGVVNKLESHHILYKSKFPELSLNINNGILLCHNHHMELHYGTTPHQHGDIIQ